MSSPINSTYVRKINRQKVLEQIRRSSGISRQDLAERIGLTPPAISGIVKDWLLKDVVRERGQGVSVGGRRPVRLILNSEIALVIGAELTRKKVRVSVADLVGNVIEQHEWELDMREPEQGCRQFSDKINELLEKPPFKRRIILGLGIAMAGLYNHKLQRIHRSVNLGAGWNNFNIIKYLQKKIPLPIRVENNSNACALAEYWLIQKERVGDLVWVNLGEGISAGLIQNGRWIRGGSNYSGEIGHVCIHPEGELCNCGNRGCLEAYWGWLGIKNRLMRTDFFQEKGIDPEAFDVQDWLKLIHEKDDSAQDILEQMGRDLGRVLSQVINILNPSRVFLGGPLAQTLPDSLQPLQEVIAKEAFPEVAGETKLFVSEMTKFAGSLGGCSLILQEVFQESESEIFSILEGEA